MCREGGCGCCVVSVTRNDLSTGKDVIIAVNSVSTPDLQCDIKFLEKCLTYNKENGCCIKNC